MWFRMAWGEGLPSGQKCEWGGGGGYGGGALPWKDLPTLERQVEVRAV